MTEIWKDINGFEGIYRISNQGNVLSVRNNIILKPYKKGNGYLGVKLQLRGKHMCLVYRTKDSRDKSNG